MNKKLDEMATRGEEYLMSIMTSDDPQLLRGAALEMIVVVGHLYRKIQYHMLLHPVFFLAGFVAAWYLT